jgi:hypothetical protein
MAKEQRAYPVHLKGEIDKPSRALWLVKWFLAIPHWFVLAFLCVAFVILTIIAFFAILFTGRYPRGMFNFNVGALRWGWRVFFYAALMGTDKYPPFTLDSVEYPADLQIDYPEKLNNWMVLVKWFLAVPHIAILGALASWVYKSAPHMESPQFGLMLILVIIVAVVLLFTGRYHKDIFKLIMGIQRWSCRVGAYVGLMTDEYPPFRLWE